MMALALCRIEKIEEDPSLVANATKECFSCDPDNPLAVPRATCPTCGGSGREKFAALEIVEEISGAKTKVPEDDDLYLEY